MGTSRRAPRWVALVVAALLQPGPGPWVATVVRVVDGDTVDVRLEGRYERVRLVGMDTPEPSSAAPGVVRWAAEASRFVTALLPPGSEVRLELDVQQRDRFGRLLAYLYLPDGRMLNEVLLQEGLAQLLTIPPDVRHADRFVAAQRQAREAGRGIWAGQPPSTPSGIRIAYVDRIGEEVALVNEGDDPVDLSGWQIVSVTGDQRFFFPWGTQLGPGRRLMIRSGPRAEGGSGVLVWTKQPVWNDLEDPAELRDPDGRVVSRYPGEPPTAEPPAGSP